MMDGKARFRMVLVNGKDEVQVVCSRVTATFLMGLPIDFRCFAQCALPQEGTLKMNKLDRLPFLHIHRNQAEVRTTLHSIP